ncbi:uncharacterized protein [Asterias amurensis]|uniref:uncharacterized protein isoform X1 n=2 Tax=Asterias amurensis TaxID=7602 RepID=UPI003AB766C1
MAPWKGFGSVAGYSPQNTELKEACFNHFDGDRDGSLNEDEFHSLCCDLFTIDGTGHVVSKSESLAMMKVLGGKEFNGHITREGFDHCWRFWFNQILTPKAALIVVDVQNDFIDGTLALRNCPASQEGADVVPVINQLLDFVQFDVVVYTKDLHPPNHMSFYDNLHLRRLHPSSKVKAEDARMLDTVVFDRMPLVDQTLWPVHCIEGTYGAEFHPDLKIVDNHIIAPKGTDPEIESYSVLMDNTKQVNKELVAELRQRAITDVYVCGLAYDLCAGSTAMDAQSLGYRTMVVEDATRCVCHEKTRAMEQGLLNAGCLVGKASEVPAMVSMQTRPPRWGLVAALNVAAKLGTGPL